jgi:hypothetical protein
MKSAVEWTNVTRGAEECDRPFDCKVKNIDQPAQVLYLDICPFFTGEMAIREPKAMYDKRITCYKTQLFTTTLKCHEVAKSDLH